MPTVINGLPAHILLVHAVVVLVPMAAVLTIAAAAWPVARHRLGVVTPILAFVALALVPVTTNAGEWFKRRLGPGNDLLERHASLGRQLLPWVIGLFLVAALGYALHRYGSRVLPEERNRTIASIVVIVLAVVVGAGSIVQTVRIGDSGSKAVYDGAVDRPAR